MLSVVLVEFNTEAPHDTVRHVTRRCDPGSCAGRSWRCGNSSSVATLSHHTSRCAHSHIGSYPSAHRQASVTPTFHRVLTECREPEGGRIELATYHRATDEAVRNQPARLYDVLRQIDGCRTIRISPD